MTITYADGEPCWVSVAVPDVPKAVEFYSQLFGWEAQPAQAEFGGYTTMALHGKPIGGIGTNTNGQTPWWTPFFKVADVHAVGKAVEAGGGAVILDSMDVGDQLTMATYVAPDGALFSVEQPKAHQGAQAWDETGAVGSLTLLADTGEAVHFYQHIFDWETSDGPGGVLITARGGRTFASMHVMDPQMRPEGARPSWIVNFRVADTDATAATATKLGATVTVGPADLPGVGRTAFLIDPSGAGFTVYTPV